MCGSNAKINGGVATQIDGSSARIASDAGDLVRRLSIVWETVVEELPAGGTRDRSEPAGTALGLPTRSALLEPPVSVDHHGMWRRREESG